SGALSAEIGGSRRSIAATDRLIFRRGEITPAEAYSETKPRRDRNFQCSERVRSLRRGRSEISSGASGSSGEQSRQRARRLLPARRRTEATADDLPIARNRPRPGSLRPTTRRGDPAAS